MCVGGWVTFELCWLLNSIWIPFIHFFYGLMICSLIYLCNVFGLFLFTMLIMIMMMNKFVFFVFVHNDHTNYFKMNIFFVFVEIWIQNKKTERILWSDQFCGQEFHSTIFLDEKRKQKKPIFFAANHIRLFNT